MMRDELFDFMNRRRSVCSLRWCLDEPDPTAPHLTPLQEYLQQMLQMKMTSDVSSHSDRIHQVVVMVMLGIVVKTGCCVELSVRLQLKVCLSPVNFSQ